MKFKISMSACVVGLAVLLLCLPAFSQVNLGRISGNVTDSSGGTMAGARVTITDQDRGTTRLLVTDEAGAYAAPSLTPGQYTVRVEANGFSNSERKDVPVTVGGDTRVDMTMKAGSSVQTVTVTEALPLINTTSATLGGVMESKEVTDIPVIGRNWLALMQLTPGVASKPGGGSNANASNGMRTDGNNYLFEGIFSGGVRTAGNIVNSNSSTGDGASMIPADAIQEVGVNFQNKAEFGWRPGVATNVGVKSGTNSIHGTAFAQGQDGSLNARNPFNPAPNPVPLLTYEQYGATAGGPIKKDKLFWYAAFEGMQYIDGTPTNLSVPTTSNVGGLVKQSIPAAYTDLAAQVAAGKIASTCTALVTVCFNPAAVNADGSVNNALLTPQQQLSQHFVKSGIFENRVPDSSGLFAYGFNASRDPNKNVIGKIDWQANDKNHVTGEYFWAKDTELDNSTTITQPYWLTDYYLTFNVVRGTWTYIPSSTWVNELHVGYDRKIENQWPVECAPGRAAAAPVLDLNTGLNSCQGSNNPTLQAMPDIAISGFATLGTGGGQRRVEGYWTVDNIVSYTNGNHNVKFGYEMRRSYADLASYSGTLGTISFGTNKTDAFSGATPLEDYLMGFPSTTTYTAGNPRTLTRNWNYGLFAQDDWRITPRITINIGLRWEYESPLTGDDGTALAVFDPTSVTGLTQVGTGLVKKAWNPSFFGSNIQPRFGMAWDLTGKGTTVLRAAYGIYSSWPVWSVINGLTSNPTAANFVAANGTVIPGGGSIGTGSVTFTSTAPSTAAATLGQGGSTGGFNWTQAGPMFGTGQFFCGDNLGSVNPLAATGAANPQNPGTCKITAVDQHWQMPYVQEWNIGVQHAVTSTMSVDIAYVGTHGTNLFGQTDFNEATPGNTTASRIQTSRPYFNQFPWFGSITNVTNMGFSNYNALQVTLTQRNWHGLTNVLGYTWSHTLDTAGTDVGLAVYPDARCPNCNYGPTAFDIRNRMTDRFSYLIPGVKKTGQILTGWSVSAVVNLQAGIPYDTRDTSDNISGTGENTDRWDLVGVASDFNSYGRAAHIPCFGVAGSTFGKDAACTSVPTLSAMPAACQTAAAALPINPTVGTTGSAQLATLGCYVSGNSVIVPPAQGTFGNMGRAIFRGAPFQIGDVSLRKSTKISERFSTQLQFDMYNVTNKAEYAIPGGNGNGSTNAIQTPSGFGKSASTPNVSNGNVVAGSGDARRYQFGLKISF